MPESFGHRLPAIIGGAVATCIAAAAASYLPFAGGTIAALAVGSLITGTITWATDRGLRKTAAIARATAAKGQSLTPSETQRIERVVDERHRRNWRPYAGLAAAVLLVSVGTVVMYEIAAGRSATAVVSPPAPHQQTAHQTQAPPPRKHKAATPTVSVSTVTVSPTPSPLPSSSSPSPSPSPTPTVTSSPAAVASPTKG